MPLLSILSGSDASIGWELGPDCEPDSLFFFLTGSAPSCLGLGVHQLMRVHTCSSVLSALCRR